MALNLLYLLRIHIILREFAKVEKKSREKNIMSENKNKKFDQLFWFMGGFGIGITILTLGHAALPKRVTPATQATPSQNASQNGSMLSEIKGGKVAAPELEQGYDQLAGQESRYAESAAQQERLKAATARVARGEYSQKKKSSQ